MKLIHLSDLHLGKRVNEFSMLEDQAFILGQILEIIQAEQPDGVLIAGDVYDKSVPSGEAVQMFDRFLVSLTKLHTPVYIISGNHDSAERLAFGGRIMDAGGVHFSPVYDGSVKPLELEDEHGVLKLWLLPFLKPVHVRRYFPEEEIDSYTDAMATAIRAMDINPAERNILMTHQFVMGAARCESEEVSVGGTDGVDVSVFDAFDYVALGHLHGPQHVGRETVRYCGSPLKYSFSEADQHKSVTVAELGKKGDIRIRTVPLKPLHELRQLRGTYEDLTLRSFYENTTYQEDYVHLILTDEDDIPDAMLKLRTIYHNLMKLSYDNRRTRSCQSVEDLRARADQSPLELLEEFYAVQNNQPMCEEQKAYAQNLMDEIWGDRK